jgi:hypothetical protein
MPYFFVSQLGFKYPNDSLMVIVFKSRDSAKQGKLVMAGDKINLGYKDEDNSENE